MPILPPVNPLPYDSLNTVLNTARVRLNDAIAGLGGDVLTNTQPYTQQFANTAWRRMQDFLANLGYARLTQEIILFGLPPTESVDPASQVWLNWSQYFDGVNYLAPPNTPVLPQDLILPLRVWERWTGQNAVFTPMEMWLDGIPNWLKTNRNLVWEWREDALYMPGSQQAMDLRIRYAAYLPDFITVGGTAWYDEPVPIMRCLDALANWICYEVANSRGDMSAAAFKTDAEAGTKRLFNREVSQRQRVNIRRKGRSAGARCGYGDGYGF